MRNTLVSLPCVRSTALYGSVSRTTEALEAFGTWNYRQLLRVEWIVVGVAPFKTHAYFGVIIGQAT